MSIDLTDDLHSSKCVYFTFTSFSNYLTEIKL